MSSGFWVRSSELMQDELRTLNPELVVCVQPAAYTDAVAVSSGLAVLLGDREEPVKLAIHAHDSGLC